MSKSRLNNPTMRKLRNRGWPAIRYRTAECVRHGWLIEERPRGGLILQLVGDVCRKRISADEARYVTRLEEGR